MLAADYPSSVFSDYYCIQLLGIVEVFPCPVILWCTLEIEVRPSIEDFDQQIDYLLLVSWAILPDLYVQLNYPHFFNLVIIK